MRSDCAILPPAKSARPCDQNPFIAILRLSKCKFCSSRFCLKHAQAWSCKERFQIQSPEPMRQTNATSNLPGGGAWLWRSGTAHGAEEVEGGLR